MRSRPDILVLGGGGVLGEAWMIGVLAGLEDAHGIRFAECDYLLGTSAGAVVAVGVAAGSELHRPEIADVPTAGPQDPASHPLETAARFGLDITTAMAGPWIRLGMTAAEPVGARLRSGVLRLASAGTGTHAELRDAVNDLRAKFDGRLRIAAVERRTGRRIMFGTPGAPEAAVPDALAASCAVPARFAAVSIDGVEYVDGGMWSPTNLDAAPAHRGARVLCLSPTGSVHGPLTPVIRIPSRARTVLEIAAIRSVGAHVDLITPDRASARAIGADPMAEDPAAEVLAAGYAQGLGSWR